jgi:hypothetical protein
MIRKMICYLAQKRSFRVQACEISRGYLKEDQSQKKVRRTGKRDHSASAHEYGALPSRLRMVERFCGGLWPSRV